MGVDACVKGGGEGWCARGRADGIVKGKRVKWKRGGAQMIIVKEVIR